LPFHGRTQVVGPGSPDRRAALQDLLEALEEHHLAKLTLAELAKTLRAMSVSGSSHLRVFMLSSATKVDPRCGPRRARHPAFAGATRSLKHEGVWRSSAWHVDVLAPPASVQCGRSLQSIVRDRVSDGRKLDTRVWACALAAIILFAGIMFSLGVNWETAHPPAIAGIP